MSFNSVLSFEEPFNFCFKKDCEKCLIQGEEGEKYKNNNNNSSDKYAHTIQKSVEIISETNDFSIELDTYKTISTVEEKVQKSTSKSVKRATRSKKVTESDNGIAHKVSSPKQKTDKASSLTVKTTRKKTDSNLNKVKSLSVNSPLKQTFLSFGGGESSQNNLVLTESPKEESKYITQKMEIDAELETSKVSNSMSNNTEVSSKGYKKQTLLSFGNRENSQNQLILTDSSIEASHNENRYVTQRTETGIELTTSKVSNSTKSRTKQSSSGAKKQTLLSFKSGSSSKNHLIITESSSEAKNTESDSTAQKNTSGFELITSVVSTLGNSSKGYSSGENKKQTYLSFRNGKNSRRDLALTESTSEAKHTQNEITSQLTETSTELVTSNASNLTNNHAEVASDDALKQTLSIENDENSQKYSVQNQSSSEEKHTGKISEYHLTETNTELLTSNASNLTNNHIEVASDDTLNQTLIIENDESSQKYSVMTERSSEQKHTDSDSTAQQITSGFELITSVVSTLGNSNKRYSRGDTKKQTYLSFRNGKNSPSNLVLTESTSEAKHTQSEITSHHTETNAESVTSDAFNLTNNHTKVASDDSLKHTLNIENDENSQNYFILTESSSEEKHTENEITSQLIETNTELLTSNCSNLTNNHTEVASDDNLKQTLNIENDENSQKYCVQNQSSSEEKHTENEITSQLIETNTELLTSDAYRLTNDHTEFSYNDTLKQSLSIQNDDSTQNHILLNENSSETKHAENDNTVQQITSGLELITSVVSNFGNSNKRYSRGGNKKEAYLSFRNGKNSSRDLALTESTSEAKHTKNEITSYLTETESELVTSNASNLTNNYTKVASEDSLKQTLIIENDESSQNYSILTESTSEAKNTQSEITSHLAETNTELLTSNASNLTNNHTEVASDDTLKQTLSIENDEKSQSYFVLNESSSEENHTENEITSQLTETNTELLISDVSNLTNNQTEVAGGDTLKQTLSIQNDGSSQNYLVITERSLEEKHTDSDNTVQQITSGFELITSVVSTLGNSSKGYSRGDTKKQTYLSFRNGKNSPSNLVLTESTSEAKHTQSEVTSHLTETNSESVTSDAFNLTNNHTKVASDDSLKHTLNIENDENSQNYFILTESSSEEKHTQNEITSQLKDTNTKLLTPDASNLANNHTEVTSDDTLKQTLSIQNDGSSQNYSVLNESSSEEKHTENEITSYLTEAESELVTSNASNLTNNHTEVASDDTLKQTLSIENDEDSQNYSVPTESTSEGKHTENEITSYLTETSTELVTSNSSSLTNNHTEVASDDNLKQTLNIENDINLQNYSVLTDSSLEVKHTEKERESHLVETLNELVASNVSNLTNHTEFSNHDALKQILSIENDQSLQNNLVITKSSSETKHIERESASYLTESNTESITSGTSNLTNNRIDFANDDTLKQALSIINDESSQNHLVLNESSSEEKYTENEITSHLTETESELVTSNSSSLTNNHTEVASDDNLKHTLSIKDDENLSEAKHTGNDNTVQQITSGLELITSVVSTLGNSNKRYSRGGNKKQAYLSFRNGKNSSRDLALTESSSEEKHTENEITSHLTETESELVTSNSSSLTNNHTEVASDDNLKQTLNIENNDNKKNYLVITESSSEAKHTESDNTVQQKTSGFGLIVSAVSTLGNSNKGYSRGGTKKKGYLSFRNGKNSPRDLALTESTSEAKHTKNEISSYLTEAESELVTSNSSSLTNNHTEVASDDTLKQTLSIENEESSQNHLVLNESSSETKHTERESASYLTETDTELITSNASNLTNNHTEVASDDNLKQTLSIENDESSRNYLAVTESSSEAKDTENEITSQLKEANTELMSSNASNLTNNHTEVASDDNLKQTLSIRDDESSQNYSVITERSLEEKHTDSDSTAQQITSGFELITSVVSTFGNSNNGYSRGDTKKQTYLSFRNGKNSRRDLALAESSSEEKHTEKISESHITETNTELITSNASNLTNNHTEVASDDNLKHTLSIKDDENLLEAKHTGNDNTVQQITSGLELITSVISTLGNSNKRYSRGGNKKQAYLNFRNGKNSARDLALTESTSEAKHTQNEITSQLKDTNTKLLTPDASNLTNNHTEVASDDNLKQTLSIENEESSQNYFVLIENSSQEKHIERETTSQQGEADIEFITSKDSNITNIRSEVASGDTLKQTLSIENDESSQNYLALTENSSEPTHTQSEITSQLTESNTQLITFNASNLTNNHTEVASDDNLKQTLSIENGENSRNYFILTESSSEAKHTDEGNLTQQMEVDLELIASKLPNLTNSHSEESEQSAETSANSSITEVHKTLEYISQEAKSSELLVCDISSTQLEMKKSMSKPTKKPSDERDISYTESKNNLKKGALESKEILTKSTKTTGNFENSKQISNIHGKSYQNDVLIEEDTFIFEDNEFDDEYDYNIQFHHYSVRAFEENIRNILQSEYYLFLDSEVKWWKKYTNLSLCSKHIFVRLYIRKYSWIKQGRLIKYIPKCEDLNKCIEELLKNDLIHSANPEDILLEDALKQLTLAELKEVVRVALVRKVKVTENKSAIISSILKVIEKSSGYSKFGVTTRSPLEESVIDICLKVGKRFIAVDKEAWEFFDLVYRVFTHYGQRYGQNVIRESLKNKIHNINFMNYHIYRTGKIFPNRESLKDYDRAIEFIMRFSITYYSSSASLTNCHNICKTIEPIINIWRDLITLDYSNYQSNYFLRFTPAFVYTKLISIYYLPSLAKLKLYAKEVEILMELLGQTKFLHSQRGKWWSRLCLVQDLYLSKDNKKMSKISYENCVLALHEPINYGIDSESATEIFDRMIKLEEQLKLTKRESHSLKDIRPQIIEEIVIDYNEEYTAQDTLAGKSLFNIKVTGENINPEEFALRYFKQQEGWKGYHSEIDILTTIFALTFLDILFLPLPGTFECPFQTHPLDLGTESFYLERHFYIDGRLKQIWNDDFKNLIQTHYLEHYEKRTNVIGLSWDFELNDLVEISNCIGGKALSRIFKLFCHDYFRYNFGMPDLCIWKPKEKICKFILVKTSSDALTRRQENWIGFLMRCGVNAATCLLKDSNNTD